MPLMGAQDLPSVSQLPPQPPPSVTFKSPRQPRTGPSDAPASRASTQRSRMQHATCWHTHHQQLIASAAALPACKCAARPRCRSAPGAAARRNRFGAAHPPAVSIRAAAGQHDSCCASSSSSTNSSISSSTSTSSSTSATPSSSTATPSSRRTLLATAAAVGVTALLTGSTQPAAAALVQFPASELHNHYVLVRAGESDSESQDVVLTNPAWKTSMASGLSQRGKAQVVRQTLPAMQSLDVCGEAGCWLWPSITQNAYQTAEILASTLGVGRSRIVPEYSFLDARGVGVLEGLRPSTVRAQVIEGDLQDANWRPKPGFDGTPPESAADVLTRMRQLLSVLETQYSGEDIVIIAPDSECLSVLQAAVLGLDLRRHSELAMRPGEVRPLLLSRQQPDLQPMTLPCPRPPACM